MSDDKNLSDDLNDMLGDAKDGAKKAADKAGDMASDLAEDAKEAASDFADSAKEAFNSASGDNKKVLAGVLAIILGPLGVHKFILGYNKEGIILLAITLVVGFFTCGVGVGLTGIIGLIEGIIYLTKSDEEFYNTYQAGKKPWF
jgi:TM2 domain-containing membrane protein YozV